ncbi:2-oxoglutarate dehydrogenase E1 component [Pantoea sp. Mhis]|uniref:2-oxoglutarate dehydrogenase E1 component n=1 Tax=Pantoea sp. Mhis TaxID=2576759 RepID=UPI00135B45BA|nr:2-oxoglutarate dehydrogenase E1 component [Pantoea sp. Mhis]MXP56286.1 2-oxoglutarate dehydrogenase E1 component [Pantoea sp. Mhis]
MQNSAIKSWLESSWLAGANQSYIEQLYEDFLNDPNSVDNIWRKLFQQLSISDTEPEQFHSTVREYFRSIAKNTNRYITNLTGPTTHSKQIKVLQLIDAFRFYGHQNANLDPLGLWKREIVSNLNLAYHGLTSDNLKEIFNVGSFNMDREPMKLIDLYTDLQQIYCGSIGAEYMHINNVEEKHWIQQRLESGIGRSINIFSVEEKKIFLKELIAADGLEKYLGTKFPGAKRFSLEGGDSLIPMLREIIRYAGKNDIHEIVLGMAHRGRLNVLVNVLGKTPQDLFDEFSGKYKEQLGTGDVKYHMGFSSDIITDEGGLVHLSLAFNPSHLEIVAPVVMGSVRARIDHLFDSNTKDILPITIHGDAAVIGQGVIQETLNMSQTRGYEIGGTIRIVINNQIGFTTSNLKDSRSTPYCTDIGKMICAPIFHVNADDLEAVIFVTRLALEYRNKFKRDIFIDLVCYRRQGHNEADEPSATQPIMYQKIKMHPIPYQIYAKQLEIKKLITTENVIEMVNIYRNALDKGNCVVSECRPMNVNWYNWIPHLNHLWDKDYPEKIDIKYLQKLACYISSIPDEIKMQLQVSKIYKDRKNMAQGNKAFDWGSAENLAYATLLDKGISIRLSGEDSSRGTFFHRHAVIHNQYDGSTYVPLQHIRNGQGRFEIWDSVLSEEAVLAFEYGYSTSKPFVLTIWEAQFGDFANGAQVVIDQFISSGAQKWRQMCGLVMLLPHGYEGQGPEHSSARLERYLQLCAEQNMMVCIPSTPSQIYHLLRFQALNKNTRCPLIIITPKSLLRHPLAISSLEELASGYFHPVINEIDNLESNKIKRIIFCSGKIYYELLEQRRKKKLFEIAIIRIEQLYPFPDQVVRDILQDYAHVKDFIWCQEEPLNQGAWYCSQHHFREVIPFGASLRYAGRPPSASPAVGYMSIHQEQQKTLVNDALNFDQ